MNTLRNKFAKVRDLLTISSLFALIFLFSNISLEIVSLSNENILFSTLCLTLYFTVKVIFESFRYDKSAKMSILSLSAYFISIIIGFIAIVLLVYRLNSDLILGYTEIALIILLVIGEFIASVTSLNIENTIYLRSDEESENKHLPTMPFAAQSALKYIPIAVFTLFLTAIISYYFMDETVHSFWFMVLLIPFSVHMLSLIPYFLFKDNDFIESNKKRLDEEDKKYVLDEIGKKLANKESKSCRKTNTKQFQTILHFLKNGLNPNEIFENRYTLILPGTCCGDEKLVKLLIEYGADVNQKSKLGIYPIHLASQHGSYDLLKLLVENGADINVKDADGNTALSYAQKYGFTDIVEFLEEEK